MINQLWNNLVTATGEWIANKWEETAALLLKIGKAFLKVVDLICNFIESQ